MAQQPMFVAGAAATGRTFDQAGATDRTPTDHTYAELIGTKLAKFALTIDTLWGQTGRMGEMTTRTQVQPLSRLATDIADKRFQPPRQGIPDHGTRNRRGAVADRDR